MVLFVLWQMYLYVQYGCMRVTVTICECALWHTLFTAQADIRLTDIRGDGSTVAYGNRLLTAKT